MSLDDKLYKYYSKKDGCSCDVCKYYERCTAWCQPCQNTACPLDWCDEEKLDRLLEEEEEEEA